MFKSTPVFKVILIVSFPHSQQINKRNENTKTAITSLLASIHESYEIQYHGRSPDLLRVFRPSHLPKGKQWQKIEKPFGAYSCGTVAELNCIPF